MWSTQQITVTPLSELLVCLSVRVGASMSFMKRRDEEIPDKMDVKTELCNLFHKK
jgi:hypothetical protein